VSAATTAHSLLLDPDYPALKQHVIESTGLAYYTDKDSDFALRIGARIAQLTLDGCGAYLDLLKNREAGESERHTLIGQLTIGETYFFRHAEQFDVLRDVVLPDLLERNAAQKTLRIWSAGCAIGAEPYTLAILLKQHFADRLAGWDIRIIGTDINQAFLARAGRGEFDERALRSTPEAVRNEWFARSGGSWIVRPDLRDWVSFQYHNLVEHPYPSVVHGIAALDLILCRNVMIYFDWPVIAHIIGRFHDCLVDGGWLAVGHAESNTEIFRAYRTVNAPGATVYQKTGVQHAAPAYAFSTPVVQLPAQSAFSIAQPWAPPVLPAIPIVARPDLNTQPRTPQIPELAQVRQLADRGEWTEADRRCDQFLEHHQLNAVAHFYRGLIHEQIGDHAAAERSLRRALYLNRSFVLAHYHLALLLAKAHRYDVAIQSIRNTQALLAGVERNHQIDEADGLTADDLRQLVAMHLDLWRK